MFQRTQTWLLACLMLPVAGMVPAVSGEIIERQAKDTLTVLEMDSGDELRFRLQDGREFRLALEGTAAAIVEKVTPGGIVYRFEARVRVDGQPMTLARYVCSQECFCQPYVIDGVNVWLDTVQDVFALIPVRYPRQGNLRCVPRKRARLAIQDARRRICPQETHPWIDEPRGFLDVGACYNGDDCYLGPYLGEACHVGLDINQPKGSLLFAPLDVDTQAYFNSLAKGHENNRWRGIRRWPNGDVWALQTHHLIELLVPENTPLKSGAPYATTAGVFVGSHPHTHFELKVAQPGLPRLAEDTADRGKARASIAEPIDFDDDSAAAEARAEVLHLDPWVLFWQTFEDRKARAGGIHAAMQPVKGAKTGERVTFSAQGSRAGPDGNRPIEYYWTFGDGGAGRGEVATHIFGRPGVYPVSLVVDDGAARASMTQHLTVNGDPVSAPILVLESPDEPSFRRRPVCAADVYGHPVTSLPHTLVFVARTSRPVPLARTVQLRNAGGGQLAPAPAPRIEYARGAGWLRAVPRTNGSSTCLLVAADATGLAPGVYVASVEVACPNALNPAQTLRAELRVLDRPPHRDLVLDDRDSGFYATPYFWVGHRFCRCLPGRRGYGGFYLTNGGRAAEGEFARFSPDLQAGRYEVALSEQTPFAPGVEFDVRVRHASGESVVRVRPERSRVIGTFAFEEGADGFVEVLAGNSRGLVVADAVTFQPR